MLGCPGWSDRSNAVEAVCMKPESVSPSCFRSATEQVARLLGGMLVNEGHYFPPRRITMAGSIRLFKIAGISIDINFSWIIILVLLTWSLATGWFSVLYPGWSTATYWLVSLISALLLFVSVLLHELAHSFVARK